MSRLSQIFENDLNNFNIDDLAVQIILTPNY